LGGKLGGLVKLMPTWPMKKSGTSDKYGKFSGANIRGVPNKLVDGIKLIHDKLVGLCPSQSYHDLWCGPEIIS
jgi:hypothetical protein